MSSPFNAYSFESALSFAPTAPAGEQIPGMTILTCKAGHAVNLQEKTDDAIGVDFQLDAFIGAYRDTNAGIGVKFGLDGAVKTEFYLNASALLSRRPVTNPAHAAWAKHLKEYEDDQTELERRKQAKAANDKLNDSRTQSGQQAIPLDPKNDPDSFSPRSYPGDEPDSTVVADGWGAGIALVAKLAYTLPWASLNFIDLEISAELGKTFNGASTFEAIFFAGPVANWNGWKLAAGGGAIVDLSAGGLMPILGVGLAYEWE